MSITATERTQIVELTTLMFNAAPGATYLSQIVALYEANGHNLSVLADQLASTSVYQSLNQSFQTAAEFATKLLTPLGLQGDAFANSWITSQLNAGATKSQVAYAAMQALLNLDPNASAQYQAAKATLLNKSAVAEYYSATLLGAATDLTTLQNVIAPVTSDVATVQSTENALTAAAGQTFTLTTGVDNFVGGPGNDTFNATLGVTGLGVPFATLNSGDSINGDGGSNTLNIVDGSSGAFVASPHDVIPTGVTISNIQTINLSTTGNAGVFGTQAFDTSAIAGVTAVNVISNGAGGDFIKAAATTNVSDLAATTVNVSGGNNVSVTTSTGNVAVTGAAGAVTVKGATAGVSVTGGGTNVTISEKGSVTVSGVTGAVSVTDKSAGGDTLSLQGGSTISVTATGTDAINIGAAPVLNSTGTGLNAATVAAEPTGNVTVNNATINATTGVATFGASTGAIYTNGGTSVSLTGTSIGAITDVQTTLATGGTSVGSAIGTSTLASVTLDASAAAVTITSDALTALTIQDADNIDGYTGTATVTNSNAHALGLVVGANLTTATKGVTQEFANVTDATATSISVSTTGTVPADVKLTAAKATTLAFYNYADVTLDAGSTLTKVATITDSGAGKLMLGDVSGAGFAALTTIDASAATGGVTATINGAEVFKGGAGNDVVTLNGALTSKSGGSISLGAGNDTLLAGTSASIASGVTVDGGSGTNTISASLVNVGNAAGITNFQILDVDGYGTGAGFGALDASLLGTPVSGIAITTTGTSGTATLLNLAADVTITDTSNNTGSNLVITHAGTGPDSLTVNFAPPKGDYGYIQSITSTGDTSLTVTSNGGTPGTTYDWFQTLNETDNVLSTITASGGTYLYLGNANQLNTNTGATTATADVASSLKVIDASATTGGVWIEAGASVAIGASGFNTTYDGLTIKGGTGGDSIYNLANHGSIIEGATAATTVNYDGDSLSGFGNYLEVDGNSATINDAASAAADTLVAFGNSDSITAGSGKNVTVDLNGLSDTVTLGAGKGATVNVANDAGLALSDVTTVNFGSGTANVNDNLLYNVTAGSNTAATNGDMLALNAAPTGDSITFGAAVANGTATLGAATSVAAAQTIDQAIYYAEQAAGATANEVVWFQAGGNTYIVDTGANGNGGTADDTVIKIMGLHDLSHATISGSAITFA